MTWISGSANTLSPPAVPVSADTHLMREMGVGTGQSSKDRQKEIHIQRAKCHMAKLNIG